MVNDQRKKEIEILVRGLTVEESVYVGRLLDTFFINKTPECAINACEQRPCSFPMVCTHRCHL